MTADPPSAGARDDCHGLIDLKERNGAHLLCEFARAGVDFNVEHEHAAPHGRR